MSDTITDYVSGEPDDSLEPIPLERVIHWRKNRWEVDVESYVEPSLMNEVYPKEEHFKIILDRFGIPHDLLPIRSVLVTSPNNLALFKEVVNEFGSPSGFHDFFNELTKKGIHLERFLGGGGWGYVFLMSRNDGKETSALKVLRKPYGKENWKSRFEKEVAILHKLSNSTKARIPRLIENISEINGHLFFQMEYVEGEPLSDLDLPIDPRKAIMIVKDVLETLEVVHKAGIVHRDLHLGNVMETKDGLAILDFGLARDEEGAEYSHAFRPVGAMSHCAPEKWISPSRAGTASDIFSVGVMLYKLLTGKQPFWGETYIELYETIKKGDYVAPSQVSHVPPILDLLVQEMLYPSIMDRVQTAEAALSLMRKIEPVLDLWEKQTSKKAHV